MVDETGQAGADDVIVATVATIRHAVKAELTEFFDGMLEDAPQLSQYDLSWIVSGVEKRVRQEGFPSRLCSSPKQESHEPLGVALAHFEGLASLPQK